MADNKIQEKFYYLRGQSALEYILILACVAAMTFMMVNFFYGVFDEGLTLLAKTLQVLLVSGNGFINVSK